MEAKNCILCGKPQDDENKCEHSFKKMCINCKYAFKDEDGCIYCKNEANEAKAREAIIQAAVNASPSYAISNLNFELAPIALKKPLLKCGNWEISDETLDYIKTLFV